MSRNSKHTLASPALITLVTGLLLLSAGCSNREPEKAPASGVLSSYGTEQSMPAFDGHIHNNTLAITPDEKIAVAASSQSGRVRIIPINGDPPRELSNYITPRNAIFAPDGASFYLSDSSLGVIDHISIHGDLLDRLPLGAGAFGTAMTADGSRIYVNNQAAGTVTAIDLRQRRPIAVIAGLSQPRQGIIHSAARNAVYVTDFADDSIAVVDATTNTIVKKIGGFNKIRGLSINRDGTRLYAANSGDNTISIVDAETGTTIHRVPVGDQPYGAALAPDGSVLLSGDMGSNTVTAIDPQSGSVRATITGTKQPRQAIAIGRNSICAWVLNEDLTVAEIDIPGARVTKTLG
ncbi:YncE family protein [Nocardia sp. NPDC051990]|uniref:YncE family protein n=1 Tax=Nocardia sp. NPDC051990 TaxID=3155285 RepID=UPI0034180943